MKKVYLAPEIMIEDLDATPLMAASDPYAETDSTGGPSGTIETEDGGDNDSKYNTGGLWDE